MNRRQMMSAMALTGLAMSPLSGGLIVRPAAAAADAVEVPFDVALKKLVDGNARHLRAEYTADDNNLLRDRMAKFTAGQSPHSVIITCSDSRVVPELIFDAAPGDLFTMRVAGNVVSPEVLGSAEYAVLALKVRLVVVMGHSGCGAIDAALKEIDKPSGFTGALAGLVDSLTPVAARARRIKAADPIQAAVEENALIGADRASAAQPVMAPLVKEGRLKVVAAVYDLATGRVNFIG